MTFLHENYLTSISEGIKGDVRQYFYVVISKHKNTSWALLHKKYDQMEVPKCIVISKCLTLILFYIKHNF